MERSEVLFFAVESAPPVLECKGGGESVPRAHPSLVLGIGFLAIVASFVLGGTSLGWSGYPPSYRVDFSADDVAFLAFRPRSVEPPFLSFFF